MTEQPIGKAMVQDGNGALIDECAVFAKSRDASAIMLRFEREMSVGDGQRMVLDIWQHSGEIAYTMAKQPAKPYARKENGDA